MLKFFYNSGPNPHKVALFLEEAGLDYEAVPVETRRGDQHKPDFLAINPNAKAPAMLDGDAVLFDSNAILLYLAEKTGKFLPGDSPALRAELLSWHMFVATGIGPYSGQAVHFRLHAREQLEYAIGRYHFEASRHFAILDERLADREWIVGDSYSIVDMALWGWARIATRVLGEEASNGFANIKRHVETINARPAASRVGELMQRFQFRMDVEEDARRNLFPGSYHHSTHGEPGRE
jgi:GST-like protein